MKTFLLLLLCCLSAIAQPYKPNSLNTNVLGTNLVFNPATFKLAIRGAGPGLDFWNTSGGADLKRYSIVDSGNQLRFEWHSDNGGSSLLLGTFSSDGNFAPISLSLSSGTNRLTIANNQLLLDGVPVVGDSSAPITNIYATTINVTTQHFTIGKGGSLTITNALTPQQIGASKLVATESNGALTNADGVFTTRGAVLSRGASAWVQIVPSTAGYVFTDGGVGADPTWAAPAGVGGIYRDQSIEAGAMFAGPTAATTGTYTNTVNDTLSDSWTFADAVTQSTRFALTFPDFWNVGTVKLKLYATCDGTNTVTTTNLVWGVKAGSLAPLEALTNAVFGTEVFVTNGLSTVGNVLQVFTTPAITVGGTPAAGHSIWFNIARQGANAADDWTNTPIRLLKCRIQWLESTTAPSAW